MRQFTAFIRTSLSLGLVVFYGCVAHPRDTTERKSTGCTSQAIIGGIPALDSAWEFVVAIGTRDEHGQFHLLCSASLISASLVVTAKHCLWSNVGSEALARHSLLIAVGSDTENPKKLIEVDSADSATPDTGGVAQIGSDISVLHLKEPLVDIRPIMISTAMTLPSSGLLDSELIVCGYGSNVSNCPYVTNFREIRRKGSVNINATRGNVFDYIYGDRATFLALAATDRAPAELETLYDNGWLLINYEAWAERLPGASQPCHGDSGGPVLSPTQDGYQLVGVISWTWRSATELCDYGSVIAIFGPDAAALLKRTVETPYSRRNTDLSLARRERDILLMNKIH